MYLAPRLTISAMAGVLKCFKRQSLQASEETGLSEVATNEADAAVERISEEEEEQEGARRSNRRAKVCVYPLHT